MIEEYNLILGEERQNTYGIKHNDEVTVVIQISKMIYNWEWNNQYMRFHYLHINDKVATYLSYPKTFPTSFHFSSNSWSLIHLYAHAIFIYVIHSQLHFQTSIIDSNVLVIYA